jgi:hypothetical protein
MEKDTGRPRGTAFVNFVNKYDTRSKTAAYD